MRGGGCVGSVHPSCVLLKVITVHLLSCVCVCAEVEAHSHADAPSVAANWTDSRQLTLRR